MRSQTGRTIVRVIAVLLCVVGVVLSFNLLQKHETGSASATIDQGGLMGLLDKGCTTIIPEADCDEVIKSQWGSIPWGDHSIPTALLGLYYFTAVFWWFLLIGPVSHSRRAIHIVVTAIMALGLGFSIFLAIQIWKLPHVCTWCLFTHAANLLLFVCMLILWPRRPRIVGVSAPGLRGDKSEGLFPRERVGVAHLEQDWPSGWALLVLPIIVLLSFALETPGMRPSAGMEGLVRVAQSEAEMYRREAETYRKMAAGDDVTKELQEHIAGLQEALQRAGAEFRGDLTKRENEVKSLREQIDALQKVAQGKPVAAEMEKLQKDLKTAQEHRDYWQKQYKRYDDRWQHTYTAWVLTAPVKISMENARVLGPADAKHTLTIYSDYQCPTCKRFEDMLRTRLIPLAERYGGLRVVFKMWPISTKCNAQAKNDLHPAACDAALAAHAAFMLGGNDAFWKMHDILFATQESWKVNKKFESFAVQIGLNPEAFRKAMASDEAMAAVKADIEEGINLGKDLLAQGLISAAEQEAIAVDSTPSIFIDNKRLSSAHHFKTWQTILQGTTPAWKPELRRTASQPADGASAAAEAATPANP